jgi:ATP-dependent DNA helicase RecG
MSTVQQSFDRELVPEAHFDDLDLTLVERTIRSGSQLDRYRGALDPRSYLLRFGGVVALGDELRPTVAGVLAFAREPERWLTASGIDVAIYREDRTLPTRSKVIQMRGPIFQVIDDTVAVLEEECTISHLEGARLVRELDTPLIVLRELTTNAVVHRDLSLYGSQVRIQAFPSTIEWISPGGLPGGITVETLLTAQFARNPGLAQFLFHAGYIEKFGMGLDSVIDALREVGLGDPEFHDDKHSFRVRVQRRAGLAPLRRGTLTREDRAAAILGLFTDKRAWRQHELQERLGLSRSTLQRDLDWLVRAGHLLVRGATKSRVYQLPDTLVEEERPR